MKQRLARYRRPATYGALAGIMGAACMTVIRSAARRFGFIEKTVPQVIEERLASKVKLSSEGTPSLHHALDQVLHLFYGAAYGAVYGALFRVRKRSTAARGLGLGVSAWLIGSGAILPMTGATRGLWRRSAAENGVDLLAHLAFGVATEFVRDDLIVHTERVRPSRRRRRAARAG